MPNDFFAEQSVCSEIKTEIVTKFFSTWATIVGKNAKKLGYVDIFSGPGYYGDGSESTPIKIIKEVIAEDNLRNKVVMLFNDKNSKFTEKLRNAINSLNGIDSLKYKPKIFNTEASDFEYMFTGADLIPTFSFIDPFGYKGLTIKILHALTKGFGSDCVFFFNYSEIRRAINNNDPEIKKHMQNLFGEEMLENLIDEMKKMSNEKVPSNKQQSFMLEELFKSLQELGLEYCVPFTFERKRKNLVHMLIYGSKKFIGYNVMNGIMANRSQVITPDGFASFKRSEKPKNDFFPEEEYQSAKVLEKKLLRDFHKQQKEFKLIHVECAKKFEYVYYMEKNFKKALKNLEKSGKVEIIDPKSIRKPKADNLDPRCIIKFL